MNAAADYHRRLPGLIHERVAALHGLLKRFNPLDLIAFLAFRELAVDPETYKEYEHHGLQAHIEYLTLLCLKQPYRDTPVCFENDDPSAQTLSGRRLDKPGIEQILENIAAIFRDTVLYYATERATMRDDAILADVRFRTIVDGLIVRNPGYRQHLVELLGSSLSFRSLGNGFSINSGSRSLRP